MRSLLLILLLTLAGCTDVSKLVIIMNDRGIRGCYTLTGVYPPFIGVHGIVATGGETAESCREDSVW